MTLTVFLDNPAPVAAPKGPVHIPVHALAILAKALNTVTYGDADETVDGSATACEDFWLSDLSVDTLKAAIEHIAATNSALGWSLSVAFMPLISHATSERRMLDVVREGSQGPELRLSQCEDPEDPRRWTYRRMLAALSLMKLPLPRNAAGVIIQAADRITNACIDSPAARDAERLGRFAEKMIEWNDDPVLVCLPATIPVADVMAVEKPTATPDP